MNFNCRQFADSGSLTGLLAYKGFDDEITAFRYAIDLVNENKTLLSQTRIVPEVVLMSSIEESPSNIVRNGKFPVIEYY